ncbi:MAG: hypothetical protein KDA86_00130 [Planctomycetaceae bacterium]|nr:hypothetical protein [Planctomycetaceae bacterium]
MTKHLYKMLSLLAILAALFAPQPASAAETLDDAVTNIANRIEAYLKEKNQLQINIRDFNGPPNSSSGRKIKNLLEEELKKRTIEIAPFSNWEVRGDFEVSTEGRFATVVLITRLVNNQGAEVADFRQRVRDSIDDLGDVLSIAQPSGFDGESATVETSVTTETPGTSPPAGDPAGTTQPAASPDDPAGESNAAQAGNTQPATPPAQTTPPAQNPPVAQNTTPTQTTPPTQPGSGQSPPPAGGTPPAVGGTPPAVAGGTPPGTPGVPGGSVAQGGTVSGVPSTQERDQRLIDSLNNPGFFSVNETTIAASSSSPYHVQVKVLRAGSSDYETLGIREVGNGLAFCDLKEGDRYSIIVTNTAPHDVGVELMIDGINSLHLSEVPGFAETGKWLIRGTNANGGVPYSARIDGWYRNPEQVYEFQVTSEPDAVATALGFPAKIGTITATFYGAWKEGEPVHPLEAQLAAQLGAARGLGTGQGAVIGSRSEISRRIFGTHPLASVSIRYVNPDPPVDLPIEAAN